METPSERFRSTKSLGSEITNLSSRPAFGVQFRNFDPSLGYSLMEKIGEVGKECEDLSYDSLWMVDHLAMRPPIATESQPIPECWTTVSYLAQITRKIHVGSLVSCVLFRDLSYLGRVCRTINELAPGRLEIGIGAGWFEDEFRAYGIAFPETKERSRSLENAALYLGNLFKDKQSSNTPRIWIGGSGESRTLKTVARYGDACSLFGDPETVGNKIRILKGYRSSNQSGESSSSDEFVYSKHSNVIIGRDNQEVRRKLSRILPNESKWPAFIASNIVGSQEECVAKVRRFMERGVNYFTLSFPDLFEVEPLRFFNETVVRSFDREIFA